MRKLSPFSVIAGVLFALGCSLAPASDLPASKPLKIPVIKYEKYKLANGLEVLTYENHRLPLVAVDLWYHVGPMNEKAGRTGFAHLFEHMMFEGSEHVGEKAHFKYLEGAGATDINGTTDFDRTNYFETLPSNQLELGLWLESDRMGFLLETLDRAKLTNQRDVVRNELRQDEGMPYNLADEEIYHQLFPKGHPYYAAIIGSHADVEAARLLDVRDFFQHYYTPNNASIAIAGDFDPAQLKALLEKYFGPIPAGPPVGQSHRDYSRHHRRASRYHYGYRPAATGLFGVADTACLSTGRCRCRPFRDHPRFRQVQPALPQAGLRATDRPIGQLQ